MLGCTPTKTMIASAKTAYTVNGSAKYGILTNGFRVDMNVIHSRKQKVVESFRNGSQNGLEKTENLELIFGLASFTGERKMKVVLSKGGEEEITADKIFIDTGSHPSIPDIEGLKQVIIHLHR